MTSSSSGASLGGLALFLGLPLAVLVERSLAVGDGYGLDAYEALGRPTSVLLAAPWEAVVNSIVYAAAATLIAVVVGGLAAFAVADSRGRLIDSLVLLPLGVSAVMLGLGFLIAFDTAAARLPRGSVARPGRPGAHRDPLRRADPRADAALDRPAPA